LVNYVCKNIRFLGMPTKPKSRAEVIFIIQGGNCFTLLRSFFVPASVATKAAKPD
jgi:hypothetical protein